MWSSRDPEKRESVKKGENCDRRRGGPTKCDNNSVNVCLVSLEYKAPELK